MGLISPDVLDLNTNLGTDREVIVTSWNNVPVTSALAMPEVYAYPKPEIFRFGYAVLPSRSALGASNLFELVNGQNPNLLMGTHTYELDLASPSLLAFSSDARQVGPEIVSAPGVRYGWWRVLVLTPVGLDAPDADDLTESELDLLFSQLAQSLSAEARFAQRFGLEALVLDLEGLRNMVPLAGTDSAISEALKARWESLAENLRNEFSGKLIFAVTLGEDGLVGVPTFDSAIDGYWVDWRVGLPVELAGQDNELAAWAYSLIQNEVVPNTPAGKYIYIGMNIAAIPSAGYDNGVAAQTALYGAVLSAVNDSENVEGVISDGMDTTLAIQDDSASVFGKPAQELLWVWFNGWAGK